jgi:hypothetical protein
MFAVLMPFTPCGRALSVDRWLALRRAARTGSEPPSSWGPTWAIPLIGLQITSMYFWAAYDKCTWAFASGQRLHAIFQWYYGSADPIEIAGFSGVMAFLGVSTIVAEFGLAILPWWRPARNLTLLGGMLFHGALYVMLPVGPFSATVWVMYLAYYSADEVDGFVRRLLGAAEAGPLPAAA